MSRLSAYVLTALLLVPAAAADWNQWRGADRDSHSPGEAWPADLSSLEELWSLELGKGYPGPVLSDELVFVVESVKGENVSVQALERSNGEVRWQRGWDSDGSVPFFAAANGDWVRSTPALDDERLYVGDMQEVLVALDAATGEERWKIDFPARYETKVPDFGFSSSPLLAGGALYVQAADSVFKIDAKSGEVLWRALAQNSTIMSSGAFSSPILAELDGKEQLIVQGRVTLHGLDPSDGEELWSHEVPNFRGMNILTPIVHGGGVFTSGYKQKAFFYSVDGAKVAESWTLPAAAYMSSPVVVDGHVYMHLANRRLSCIDLESGEERWRTSESFGKYQSLVARGDKILALDEQGELILFAADPAEFRLLDRQTVSERESWAHLAVEGDELYVRDLKGVSAYRLKRP